MALTTIEQGLIKIIVTNIRANMVHILLMGNKEYVAMQMRNVKAAYLANNKELSTDLCNTIHRLWNVGMNTLVPNTDVLGDASTLFNVEEDEENTELHLLNQ